MSGMSDYTISFTYFGNENGCDYEEEVLSLDIKASDYEHASVLADSLSSIMKHGGGGFYSASVSDKE
jgi:hypothetical protein